MLHIAPNGYKTHTILREDRCKQRIEHEESVTRKFNAFKRRRPTACRTKGSDLATLMIESR
jgi:hypothetical protein